MSKFIVAGVATWFWLVSGASLQAFGLPTANHAIFEPGGEDRFFAPTPGKPWTSGTFGSVRSEGRQMHEGLDIRSVQHDRHGEPTDPVMASVDGTVVYINRKPALSNYGNYIVLRHQIDGMDVFTLYAHLSQFREGLRAGMAVKAGEVIAIMGRTSNTRARIAKDRAHVHFEINLFMNENFAGWYKRAFPGERNDHGIWNGQNLFGLDPRLILLDEHAQGTNFSLLRFIAGRPELCRVLVRERDFPWLRRYPQLVAANPLAAKEGVAGYEISLDFNAIPFRLIPRAASEIGSGRKFELVLVNDAEALRNPSRHLLVKSSEGWRLTEHGVRALELLVYPR
jgi:murein DD-endopeptidase MepM/ murein hydrolase activator NlpD